MTDRHVALHPGLRHVATLLGTWSGQGHGDYPSIDAFDYAEAVTFSHVGKPFLAYAQRTRSLGAPASPMHAESGFWRFPGPGAVEVVLSHPTGITEVEQGTLTIEVSGEIVIDLRTTVVGLTTTAKSVTEIARRFRVVGDELHYEVSMAAEGHKLQPHLAAHLTRE